MVSSLFKRLCLTSALASGMIVASLGIAQANPEDGVVTGGSASIVNSANRVDIHQTSNRAVIDWRSFNIESHETTQFHQPGSSSIAVNRVNDGNPSHILGHLKANGNIILINPSGVMFGKDSVVDVNGLIATTSDISNTDAMTGNLNFVPSGTGAIVNNGTITAAEAGLVGLVAPHVENNGTITAKLGKVQLAAGDSFSLDLYGDGLINVAASNAVTHEIVKNAGTIDAAGGTISITAATGANLVKGLIEIKGELKAPAVSTKGGTIIISGDRIGSTATMDVSGNEGGIVSITGNKVIQQGKIRADGTQKGGTIEVSFKDGYIDNEQSLLSVKGGSIKGGTIKVAGKAGSHAFVSGQYDASGSMSAGGEVQITAKDGDLKLFGSRVTAKGATKGGTIYVGGEYQGKGSLDHALTTSINYATSLDASATGTGDGGTVVVWSDQETLFGGKAYATGGSLSGNGGLIEISSKDTLRIAGNSTTDASAINGTAGNLLLDPKNIIIANSGINGGGISYFEFIDPNPDAGMFGSDVSTLSTGNVIVHDPFDDFIDTDTGAVYLFNGNTGALISTLYGTTAGDQIGFDLYNFTLSNGNYVMRSYVWDNGAIVDAGASTFIDGTIGLSGSIDATNSLVGSSANDNIGNIVTELTNGNYVVSSGIWDNGGIVDAGAVTWANGLGGTVGVIDTTNSLVGTTAGDQISIIRELTNGNYAVIGIFWDNGPAADAGSVTWGNGLGGTVGIIDATNSIVGSTTNDYVGNYLTPLSNGNFVIQTADWDRGGIVDAGAVTWMSGTGPTVGVVSAANSLVGTVSGDITYDLIELTNGNYVVLSPEWDNGGIVNAGAATWVDGTVGLTGFISVANSLHGTSAFDHVGQGGVALTNGNYVIISDDWNNGGIADAGAVTWADGTIGITGAVSTLNSLHGTSPNDFIGTSGVYALTNGNYVVTSHTWDNGGTQNVGAVTWANGTTGITGAVSTLNSLHGSTAFDHIGVYGARALTNGNYIVLSPSWDNGGAVDAGAVTWADGTTGITGAVSTLNSLHGTTTNDRVGDGSMIALQNGNYLIQTSNWDNGGVVDAGAVTWGNGTSGISGAVSTANSLYGTTAGDMVGSGYVYRLANSNYIVGSFEWDNGGIVNAGAVTWGDGTTGVTGAVSTANSVYGSSGNDQVGRFVDYTVFPTNGDYFIDSYEWDNGPDQDVGAITLGNGTTGTVGAINTTNSIIGSTAFGFVSGRPDNANSRLIIGDFTAQRLFSAVMGGVLNDYDSYTNLPSSSVTLAPAFITAVLDAGTNVTLQANNDITLSNDLITNNGGGAGGDLTLQAGRSILLNANIFTDDGNLNLFANEDLATGVVNAQRDAGDAVITMGVGTSINAGAGDVHIRLDNGAGKTNHGAGSITLRTITANTILAENLNTTGDIILASGGLTAAGAGDAIVLASLRNFINNIGAGALTAPAGRWLVYSTHHSLDVIGSLPFDFQEYNCTYGGACPAFAPTDNGLLYSMSIAGPPVTPQDPEDDTPTSIPDTVAYTSLGNWTARVLSFDMSGKTVPTGSLWSHQSRTSIESVLFLDTVNFDILDTLSSRLPSSLINWVEVGPALIPDVTTTKRI